LAATAIEHRCRLCRPRRNILAWGSEALRWEVRSRMQIG
jgi:hypothetical protein